MFSLIRFNRLSSINNKEKYSACSRIASNLKLNEDIKKESKVRKKQKWARALTIFSTNFLSCMSEYTIFFSYTLLSIWIKNPACNLRYYNMKEHLALLDFARRPAVWGPLTVNCKRPWLSGGIAFRTLQNLKIMYQVLECQKSIKLFVILTFT